MDTGAIIDRLGGTRKAARICRVTPAAVTLWKRSGIPPLHWSVIVEHARLNGVDGVTYDTIQSARNAAKAA